jgi:preprotein translocase SecE subunit
MSIDSPKETRGFKITKIIHMNSMDSIKQFLNEVKKELSLTTFPSRYTTVVFTAFVVLFTVVVSAYLGVLDFGFGKSIITLISKI